METGEEHLKSIRKIYKAHMNKVPFNRNIELEDIGFIILMSICEANGSVLIGKEIFLNGEVIGADVDYRFNGDILDVNYYSLTQDGKLITKRIKV